MSALRYLNGSANRPSQGGADAEAYDSDANIKSPSQQDASDGGSSPSFLSGFRRTRSERDRSKAKASLAASASVAENARKFVKNFVARKEGDASDSQTDTEDEAESRPRRFNPTAATGSKGFIGAVANHLQENEARKAKLKAHRAHQLAVKGIYNKKAATTPTTAPAGAPRFFHTLPTTLPQSYFSDLGAKADEAQLPTGSVGGRVEAEDGVMSPNASQNVRDFASYWECDEVSRDMVQALKIAHSKGLYGKSSFVANERVQSLKDVPLRELAQGDFLWRTWRSAVDSFITTHATTALNARYMLGSGKRRFIVIGNSSVLDALEGVLVHVWRSNVAAKEFISGWRRVWRAVFENRLEGVTCPMSAAYRIQGSYVSVTALVPIEPAFNRYHVDLSPGKIWGSHGPSWPGARVDLHDLVPDGPAPIKTTSTALTTVMQRFCHAMCIDVPPPLMLGLDGRYYILDVRHVLQCTFGDPSLKQRPRLDLLLQMRDLRGLIDASSGCVASLPAHVDRYREESTGIRERMTAAVLSSPLKFVKVVAARRCAIEVLRTLAEMDLDAPISTEIILDKNLVSQLCHRYGLNLCFLPLLIDEALTAEIPEDLIPEHQRVHLAGQLAEACRVEMLSRTLKELSSLDLNFGVTASTPINDVARRIHVPNRIASFTVGKDVMFLQDQVMPRLHSKFYGLPEGTFIDPSGTSAGRLLRNVIFHLGCELSAEQKRFTHYCPVAQTYAMVMRPPKTAEMYLAKQFSDLDSEVPLMWHRWSITPIHSPVRHSAFVHSAFLTLLCRASEKYGFVRESADDCLPDFDDDLYRQCEILGISAEAAIIAARENGPLRAYISQLRKLVRDGETDSPIFAVKYLNAALLGTRCNLGVAAANALVRIEHATASVHSATCAFAISSAESMLVAEPSTETLDEFLDMTREHCKQARANGIKFGVRVMLHATAVLVASHTDAAGYSSASGVAFARESLRMHMEGMGPRNRCTCVALYHLMIISLRERLQTKVPAVERHLGLCMRVLDMLLKAEAKQISAMTHSERSMDLIERVARVLRDAGDTATSLLIQQERESIEKGDLAEPALLSPDASALANFDGTEDLARSQSGILASSTRQGSFSARAAALAIEDAETEETDEQLSHSLHSPSSGGVLSPHSPTADEASVSSASPTRKLRFGGAARAARAANRFGKLPSLRSDDDEPDLAHQQSGSLRLSQVNFTLANNNEEV